MNEWHSNLNIFGDYVQIRHTWTQTLTCRFFFFFFTFSDFWQMLNEAINQMMCLWKVQNLK